jgi:hypothetical protein
MGRGFAFSGMRSSSTLRVVWFLENLFEPMIGNDVIYEVAAFMYVVLSKAEKLVLYEEFIGTTEYLTL